MSMIDLEYILTHHAAPFLRLTAGTRRAESTLATIRHAFHLMASFTYHQLKSVPRIPALAKLLYFTDHNRSDLLAMLPHEGIPMPIFIK